MKSDYENLRTTLRTIVKYFGERPPIKIHALQILLEVVYLPSQSHKFYGEKLGITSKMTNIVIHLTRLGLIESNWNPQYPTRKALKPTKQGKEYINELLPTRQPKVSIVRPKPIIRHRKKVSY